LVLSKPDILKYLEDGRLRFDPPVSPDRVAQVSLDLFLGRQFTTFKPAPGFLPAIHIDPSLWNSADLWERQELAVYRLHPGQFVLAQTLEKVFMPPDLVGLVEGRSTYARVGVTIHVTAPKIDPGFQGHITLEMANFGKVPVELRAGIDKPAQLIFMQLTTPLDAADLYGTGEGDYFQGQTEPIPRLQKKS
jgi:dCTP deaminase